MIRPNPFLNIKISLGLAIFLTSVSVCTSFAQVLVGREAKTKWSLMSDSDNITIYESDVTHDGYVPLKGSLTINAPIEKVAAFLDDSIGKKKWLPAVEEIEVIKQVNPYEKIEYYHVVMPFIVSDRTFIMHSKAYVNKAKDEIFVTVKTIFKDQRLKSNLVRGEVVDSYVYLKKDGEDKTIVEGVFYTHPKGLIPNWVVTRFTRNFCRESLLKLRSRIENNSLSKKELLKYRDLMNNFKKPVKSFSSLMFKSEKKL